MQQPEIIQIGEPVYPTLNQLQFSGQQSFSANNLLQSANQQVNLLQSSIFSSSNFKTPKQVYMDQVTNEASEKMRKDLI